MRYRYLFTTTTAFVAVIITAGAWLGAASTFTGQPGRVVAVLGALFSIAFMWLLVTRLRSLLAHPERRGLELSVLLLNIGLLLVAFAWVHHRIGIMDFSGAVPRATTDFSDALYFSVVTLTTLGYGDMVPIGPGRFVAALQGLTGYFILGILVSTGFQLLAPDSDPDEEAEKEYGQRQWEARHGRMGPDPDDQAHDGGERSREPGAPKTTTGSAADRGRPLDRGADG